jgi:hypothetical protein
MEIEERSFFDIDSWSNPSVIRRPNIRLPLEEFPPRAVPFHKRVRTYSAVHSWGPPNTHFQSQKVVLNGLDDRSYP